MLVREYIKEFNKLVKEVNFLSNSNEQVLKNKLLLIQTDIKNISSSDCNSFEIFNFYSNVYHILNQSSDTNSKLISSCLEILSSSIGSRNKEIQKICRDINFMPMFCQLLVVADESNDERIIKLLILLKDSLMINNDLDEHNTKFLVSSLCDHISNSNNEKIVKLSLRVLSNLAMKNATTKFIVRKSIKATEVKQKISRSDELVEMKFMTTVMGDLTPQDFPRLVIICLKSIKEGSTSHDIEPILHSLDFLKYLEELQLDDFSKISENEQIIGIFNELNELLCKEMDNTTNIAKSEFYEKLLEYYSQLLTFDAKLVSCFSSLTSKIFSNDSYSRSSSALNYLSTYIRFDGNFSSIEKAVESLINYYSVDTEETSSCSYDQKCAFLKFISILCWNKKLDNTHIEGILHLVEKMVAQVKEYTFENIDDQTIAVVIYFLDALYALSKESNLFNESLEQVLDLSLLPCIVAKSYTLHNEDILNLVFNMTPMNGFPKTKVAKLLANSQHRKFHTFSVRDDQMRPETSTKFTRYMNAELQHEFEKLTASIGRKLDANDLASSDLIALYRHKNNFLQTHVNSANASLDKMSNDYNEAKQDISMLSKLGEKHELMNWCLQLEKEKILKENRSLYNTNKQLVSTIASFDSKIEKEFSKTRQAQKSLTLKTMEVNKLLSEKEMMDTERQKFKQAQKENENRIQQLKKDLEQEKQLRAQEVAEAVNEQKKFNEKRLAAEKENAKLQEVITLSEKELIDKANKIKRLEEELKEAEKVQASIMSIMQKTSKRS